MKPNTNRINNILEPLRAESSHEEKFLKKAIHLVEIKLDDNSLDFEYFASEMANSKSTLHRRMKSLTGLSPMEFIRRIRLKHAITMLANNCGNITDIAYAVGFNDPKYFSRCFKDYLGLTPIEFKNRFYSKQSNEELTISSNEEFIQNLMLHYTSN
jgi:transcriptional regulator GlxA family with amidase domain